MQPNIIIYFGTAQNVHPTGGKLMKAWKQILQNTVTFDALTMYMLHAEYSVYSRQTLNEYITYQRGKTFASRRSNILKTGT